MKENEAMTGMVKEGNIVGFILGLVGVIAWFLPIIGLPVTIINSALGVLLYINR